MQEESLDRARRVGLASSLSALIEFFKSEDFALRSGLDPFIGW
jgi:hypothetical protein